jgi:hypothetical protein
VLLKHWQNEARAKQAAAAPEASTEPAEETPEVTPVKPVVQGVKRGRASSPSRAPSLPTSRQLSMQNQVQIDKYINNRTQKEAEPEIDENEEQEKELLEMGADGFALRHFGSQFEMQKACCGESCINRICFTECSPGSLFSNLFAFYHVVKCFYICIYRSVSVGGQVRKSTNSSQTERKR